MKRVRKSVERLLYLLPDKAYLYVLFFIRKHELLNLRNPQKSTEKIQWLKLYGKLERFAKYADKLTVRDYIKQTIGDQYLIPLLGVWDNFEDIDFDKLPSQFVLKVSNGCGYNYICKDKSKIDYESLKSTINTWMRENFYKQEREPQYKPNTSRIICEQYLEDESGELRDYKFYCSKGVPKIMQVDSGRFTDGNRKSDFMDMDWKRVTYVKAVTFGDSKKTPNKPKNLKKMIKLATKLSRDFPFVRVDLYSLGDKIYFGELTFTPGSGLVELKPLSGDLKFAEMIDLNAYSNSLAV